MGATETAQAEAEEWARIAWLGENLDSVDWIAPTELAVTGFDPTEDLHRRARGWMHQLEDHSIASLTRFGAGMAAAEASAWERDDPTIATRALSDRRFLFGDRLVHWAVPWGVALSRAVPVVSEDAGEMVHLLLSLGERHRPARALTGTEGLNPPGSDSIGGLGKAKPGSLFSGWVGEIDPSRDQKEISGFWTDLAERHPGTARLWLDMASRAESLTG